MEFSKSEPRPSNYRPELDVIRFIAFLCVFFYHLMPGNPAAAPAFFRHAPWLMQPLMTISNAAVIGLPLFFVLSAFLIAEVLMTEQEKTGTIHLKQLMFRRILRICPLYYFALVLAILPALHHHLNNQIFFVASCAVFLANWSYLIQPIPFENAFGPLWSISLQEQCYAIFPPIFKATKGRFIGTISIAVILISCGYLCYEGSRHFQTVDVRVNLLSEAMFYGAGMLIAVCLHQRNYAVKNVYRVLMIALAGTIAYATASLHTADRSISAVSLITEFSTMALACSLLLLALYRCEWKFPKWMISLGKISYGLYVFHAFSMGLFSTFLKGTHLHDYVLRAASLSLTIVLAQLSYRFIEKPFLRLKNGFSFTRNKSQFDGIKADVDEPPSLMRAA